MKIRERLDRARRHLRTSLRFVRWAGRALVRDPVPLPFDPLPEKPGHPSELCECDEVDSRHLDPNGHLPLCAWAAVMCRTCHGEGWCPECAGDGCAREPMVAGEVPPDLIIAAFMRRVRDLRANLTEALDRWEEWENHNPGGDPHERRIAQLREVANGGADPAGPPPRGRGAVLAEVDLDKLPEILAESLRSTLATDGVEVSEQVARHAAASLTVIVGAREVVFCAPSADGGSEAA